MIVLAKLVQFAYHSVPFEQIHNTIDDSANKFLSIPFSTVSSIGDSEINQLATIALETFSHCLTKNDSFQKKFIEILTNDRRTSIERITIENFPSFLHKAVIFNDSALHILK